MTKESIDRILEKYSDDNDVLALLSEKSQLHREIEILTTKMVSYRDQLKGLHKFIEAKKLLETID